MNKYYFIVQDLYKVFYVYKKRTFTELLGQKSKKKIKGIVIFFLLVVAIFISNILINNDYYLIVSAVILIILLYMLSKILNEVTLDDIYKMSDSYRKQIHSFSDALYSFGFKSNSIENLIPLIQENIKKKEQKNEIRSKYTFQFFLVLFGIIGFFSKQLWDVLDISTTIKNDIYTSSVVLFLVIAIILIFRTITSPEALRYNDEERILIALQEVLLYREKENVDNLPRKLIS